MDENQKNAKIVIYTAIFGKFDKLRKPKIIDKNIKYVCFTDRKIKCRPWEIKIVKPEFSNFRKNNRKYKILSHRYFGDFQYSIYLDGHFIIKKDLKKYIGKWLGDNDIAVLEHPKKNCLYKEAEACIKGNKDNMELIQKQISKYKNEGYPENNGLTANGFIIRKHTQKIEEFNEMWWNEVKNYSARDQLSFCYVIYKLNMKYSLIDIPHPLKGNSEFLKISYHGSTFSQLKIYISSLIQSVKKRLKRF